jgi:hypothetical protein
VNIGPLLGGLLITVELTLVVIVLSLIFAQFVALAGMSRITPLHWLVKRVGARMDPNLSLDLDSPVTSSERRLAYPDSSFD